MNQLCKLWKQGVVPDDWMRAIMVLGYIKKRS